MSIILFRALFRRNGGNSGKFGHQSYATWHDMAKTNAVLEAGKPEAIERQLVTLKSITAEIDRMRLDVEAKKLAAKEEISHIQTWNAHLDVKLEEADNEVVKVRKWLDDRKKQAEVLSQEEKLQFEENCKQSSTLRRLANIRLTARH